MAHFAKINEDTKLVEQVIVAEKEFVDQLPGTWIQTSYNTQAGIHLLGGTPLRKNFAGIGFTYDSNRDAFIAPKPYPSWILDEVTCTWQAPVAKPSNDKLYIWDESTLNWIELN